MCVALNSQSQTISFKTDSEIVPNHNKTIRKRPPISGSSQNESTIGSVQKSNDLATAGKKQDDSNPDDGNPQNDPVTPPA